jgi:bacteriocin-like protein
MEDLKKQESTDLTELTDKQLDKVSGGDLPIGGIQIEGIRGESLDDKHKEEIHVMSWCGRGLSRGRWRGNRMSVAPGEAVGAAR